MPGIMVPGSQTKGEARILAHKQAYALTSGKKGIMLFLAGLEGLDIVEARKHNVNDTDLIGVERNFSVYKQVSFLYPDIEIRREDIGYVAWLITNIRKQNIRVAICDYCGTWQTSEKPSKDVLACLRKGAYMSITLCRAHDSNIEDEKHLFNTVYESLSSVKEVTHVGTITYQSERESDGSHGSPMMTMSFLIGHHDISPTIIDMRKTMATKKKIAKKTPTLAEKRHNAAVKAWKTRRKNAKK